MSSTMTARRGIDLELLEQLAVAVKLGLGRQVGGEDVVEVVDDRGNAEPVEDFPGIIGIAVGVDELAARQPLQRADQPVVSRQRGRAGCRGRRP